MVDGNGKISTIDVGGMPIVIQRPKKAIFVVTTTTYDVGGSDVDITSISEKPFFAGPSEVYTIDMKRPASGTIDYSIELENFYPKKIGAKLDDKTLAELREFAGDLISKLKSCRCRRFNSTWSKSS